MKKLVTHLIAFFVIGIFLLYGPPAALVRGDTHNLSKNLANLFPSQEPLPIAFTSDVSPSPSFDANGSVLSSAKIRKIPVVQQLIKKIFRSDEDVTLAVTNVVEEKVAVEVVDVEGKAADVSIEQRKTMDSIVVDVSPRTQFRPGKYTVIVSDENGFRSKQDFRWGVLALNTNRSLYMPGQTASISMAVLDDQGDMVCDAKVTLGIKNQELGINETFSTENKKITTNPQCTSHDFSLEPDYEASYKVGEQGTYELTLSAQTKNGIFTISDTLVAKASIPFDVERISATRIYPPHDYPVELKITANQDFTGIITETVPNDFTITPSEANKSYDKTETLYLEKKTDPEQMLQQDVQGAMTGPSASLSALLLPFDGAYSITQKFGMTKTEHILSKFYQSYGLSGHDGIDFGLPENTPLFAVDDGNIVWSGEGDYGVTIIIQHSWGRSYYGHLNKTTVSKDMSVRRGEQIGLSGNTGESTGPHLHFGIKPNEPDMINGYFGKVDPLPYFRLPATTTLAKNVDTVVTIPVLGASTSASLESSDESSAAQQTFTISENQFRQNALYDSTISQNEKVKIIQWQVSLKKGEQITLSYQFKAPPISPQFYLLGPLSFYTSEQEKEFPVFQEQRQWQIAADAIGTGWYNYDWQYRKQITIDHTKVSTGGSSDAWCNAGSNCSTSWASRVKITFDNSASGTNLTNFPVLVKVNSSRIDYAETQNAGQDIRFVDPSDNTTILSHEIETWDESGDSIIWVKVPQLDANSTTDYIWLYYNNASAADAQNATDVWSNGFIEIQHFEESTACSNTTTEFFSNSVSATNNWGACGNASSTSVPTVAAASGQGNLGRARDFNGTSGFIKINDDNSAFDYTSHTVGLWIKVDAASSFNTITDIDNDEDQLYTNSGGALGHFGNGTNMTTPNGVVNTTNWFYITLLINGTNKTLYVNGASEGSSTGATARTTTRFNIGAGFDGSSSNEYFDGKMDEVRVSNVARSADWIEAEYINMNDAMNSYGSEQNQGGDGLINFPVLISLTADADLSANVQADADDILFTDSTGTVKLDHEIERYTSGTLTAWVEVPSLSSSEDTVIYMYYGNTSASNQQNITGTWDSNYQGVWHLSQTPTSTMEDSTSNNYDGTPTNMSSGNQVTGKVGGALDFNGSTQYVDVGNRANLFTSGAFTVEVWAKPDALNTDQYIFSDYNSGVTISSFNLAIGATNLYSFYWENPSDTVFTDFSSTQAALNTWAHFVAVYAGGGQRLVYLNGAQEDTGSFSQTRTDGGGNTAIGRPGSYTSAGYFNGVADEVRYSSTARSAGWIATEYNNMNSPSTFYSVGGVETKLYAAPLESVMRHGRWFNGGGSSSIQPFVF